MECEDEHSNNTLISKKTSRKRTNNSKNHRNSLSKDELKTKKNNKKSKKSNDITIDNMFNFSFKSKYNIDLKKLSLAKSNIKFPKLNIPQKSKKSNKKNNKSENNTNEINIIKIDLNDNQEKAISYIKRFPENKQYLIYIQDNYYSIYNIKTGEKIRTQKTSDINGFQGILPLPYQRILVIGADFLKIYHYDLKKKELKIVDPNQTFPTYGKIIYFRQISDNHIIICKKSICYIYNILKFSLDKIIYLKAIIKILNDNQNKIELNPQEDFFSNCKIFSKRKFCLCYKEYIFIVNSPEGNIMTYFKPFNNKKICKIFIKRCNIFINLKKEVKKFYFIWQENSNFVKIFNKMKRKNEINDKNNKSDNNELKNKLNYISFNKNIKIEGNKYIFNIKQCSNYDIVLITINNEIFKYNFLIKKNRERVIFN